MTVLAMEPGVQVALVTAGGTVMVAAIGILAEFARRQSSTLTEVRDQVANTHDTNLRDDLDAVMYRIDRVIDSQEQHGKSIDRLCNEIGQERRERLSVSDRLDAHLESAV